MKIFCAILFFVGAAAVLTSIFMGMLPSCAPSSALRQAQARWPDCNVKEISSEGNRTTVLVHCPFQSDREVTIIEK